MKIERLKANHVTNPVGFQLEPLCLSWTVEDTGSKHPDGVQVRAALDPEFRRVCYDSGMRRDISGVCFSPELELKPFTRYYWRVRVRGDGGDEAVSETAFFETGKMGTPWNAEWITPKLAPEVHPLMRKTFFLSSPVVRARAYVCGLGLYEMEVNGTKTGEEYLAPGFHAYDSWLQYQTYDIGPLLRQGENAVGVMLGNGWYKGRFGFDGGYTNLYGSRFALLCELHIRLEDETELTIGTDRSWRCRPGPVLQSGIYDGEVYDARNETAGWSSPECRKDGWSEVSAAGLGYERLCARRSLPVAVKERRKPLALLHTPKGEDVLDFGQNMAGWVEFEPAGIPAGAEVVLQYGEVLQDGCFYRENLRTAKAEYRYTSDGTGRRVRPHFTYYGFRYVKLTGFRSADPEAFTACTVFSDLERTGRIETSDVRVNRLFLNALWGQKSNFLDVPTDCPQRDERMGWTGDAQIFCGTACFNMDSAAFYAKYMADLHREQQRLNGSVPYVVPCIKPAKALGKIDPGKANGSAAWGDAAAVIPWTVYLFSGDKSLLREQYPAMKAWVEYIRRQDDADGGSRLWKTGFHFADWLALDSPDPDSPMGGTDPYFIASAYYYYSASLTAKAAAALGKEEDAANYRALAGEVRQAVRKRYFTAQGGMVIRTQTALAAALFLNLVPQEGRVRAAEELRAMLEANGMYLNTGFVGTAYLCRALSGCGLNGCAYTLLLKEGYPSWLYEVNLGATTVWERWNSLLPDGKISGTGMNSLNHYAYGAVAEWMYRDMCGLNPSEDGPGFRRAVIRPKPDFRIRNASARYRSAAGEYRSSWEYRNEREIVFEFQIPFDASASVFLPEEADVVSGPEKAPGAAAWELEAGSYRFECRLAETARKKQKGGL